MQIVLFRHGIAEDRDEFAGTGLPDAERPLTDKGRQRTREAAAGLRMLVPGLAAIGTSPYRRAYQTAELISAAYREADRAASVEVVEEMQPGGDPSGVCRWLEQQRDDPAVALVGHEPDLSGLMAWFTTGRGSGFARFKKAGSCLIEFPSRPAREEGELQWLLTPLVLRRLAG